MTAARSDNQSAASGIVPVRVGSYPSSPRWWVEWDCLASVPRAPFFCGICVVCPFAAIAAVDRDSTGKRAHGSYTNPGNVRPDDLARRFGSKRATSDARRQVISEARAEDQPASSEILTMTAQLPPYRHRSLTATAGIKGLACP